MYTSSPVSSFKSCKSPDEGFEVFTRINIPLSYFLQSSIKGFTQSVPIYAFIVTKSTSYIDSSFSPIGVFPKNALEYPAAVEPISPLFISAITTIPFSLA